jgi:hypothetical protein
MNRLKMKGGRKGFSIYCLRGWEENAGEWNGRAEKGSVVEQKKIGGEELRDDTPLMENG